MPDTTQSTQLFAKVVEKLKELPVNEVASKVVDSVRDGKVAILTAETGSGKTLLANSMLADASDEQVLVLVPRRFLAINAAETIAELAEVELGSEVGYAVGSQAGDKSQFNPNTKLLFATYGYALSSGLLETAKTIVCDEVHEAGIDTSLARAMLHERMQHDPELRVVEMSATLNAEKQAAYWQDIAQVDTHHADGKAFPCDTRHVLPTDQSLNKLVVDLLKKENRKGIAVFRPGVREVEKTVEEVRELCKQRGMENVEVEAIYGDMDMSEREKATRAPEPGNVKVLVGTNVIESGINIKWLDTGVSDGKSKVPYHRDTGAEALVLEELPQWRIVQQEGRVKRFTDGLFVLSSNVNMESRPHQQTPEIERISLTGLIMHAAHFGIDPTTLKYDGEVDVARLNDARAELQRLDLLTHDWELTEKGKFAVTLPVGAEAAAMLYAANPAIINDAIELAAVVEVGGLRADYREPHGLDNSSDVFDGLKAFKALGDEATERECEDLHVSWKRYKEVCGLVEDMHRRLDTNREEGQRPASTRELQTLMLHGSVNRLFNVRDTYVDLVRGLSGYERASSSVVDDNNISIAIGTLREVPTRSGGVMTIVQDVTKIPKDVFAEFAASRGDVLTNLKVGINHKGREMVEGRYFGNSSMAFRVKDDASAGVKTLAKWAKTRQEEAKIQDKPQGTGNTAVREAQQQQSRAM